MRCKFKILVFQNGALDEEVESGVHEFSDGIDLGNEMARFAAMNSSVRTLPAVRGLITPRTRIQEPRINKGLGPATYLIIKEVVHVE